MSNNYEFYDLEHTFGEWLQSEMNREFISPGDLADTLGCTEEEVVSFMEDESDPDPETLDQIRNMFPGGYGRSYEICPSCGEEMEFINLDEGWVCPHCGRRVS